MKRTALLLAIALGACTTTHIGAPAKAPSPASTGTVAAARASGRPATGAVLTHGARSSRRIALTFDADMTPSMLARLESGSVKSFYDARIIALLEDRRIPATIFLTGLWASTYQRVVASLASNPLFELENHSYDHSAFHAPCYGLPTVLGARAKRDEIERAARTIRQASGVTPRYFRFPGGCYDPADLSLVRSDGETAVGWDVVSGDAFQPSHTLIEANVEAATKPGSIIVMHLMGPPNAPATFDALRALIPALQAKGFVFSTLDALLR